MASSVVSIAIRARNLIGGAVSQATSQVDNFVGAVDRTNQKFRQQRTQTGQQMSSLFGLNTAFLVLGATIGSVAIAYDRLKDAAGDAAKLQIERVGAINTAMETLGLTTQQAGRYYQGVEKRIAQLGRDLPVSVEQIHQIYRTINDDFTGQLRPRGASAQQLADLSVGASARLAILAQQGNVSTGNALANISSFLGGAGIGELRQQTLFQNNPRFFNAIKENLERYGELNRAEVLSRALEQVVTDQQIRALQGTVTAQLSGFMDKLFDPTIGVFYFSRDLDEKMEGYQSVFEEFGTTLDILIGENGIIDAIGELTGIVNIDPMLIVRDGVRSLRWLLPLSKKNINPVGDWRNPEYFELVQMGANDGLRFHNTRVARIEGVELDDYELERNGGFNDSIVQCFWSSFCAYYPGLQSASIMVQDHRLRLMKIKDLLKRLEDDEDNNSSENQRALLSRILVNDMARSVARTEVVDQEREKLTNLTNQYNGVDKIIEQLKDAWASDADMSRIQLFNLIGVSGLQSGEAFKMARLDHAYRLNSWMVSQLEEPLTKIYEVAIAADDSPIDNDYDDWSIKFPLLYKMTPIEEMEYQSMAADKDEKYMGMGVF